MATVRVNLKKDWFGPGASLHLARENPHEFPAAYADKPKKAEGESDEAFAARAKRQPFAVLPSSAEVVKVPAEEDEEPAPAPKPAPVAAKK